MSDQINRELQITITYIVRLVYITYIKKILTFIHLCVDSLTTNSDAPWISSLR